MKRIHFILLMLLLPTGLFARDYLPVVITCADGRELRGFAKLPDGKVTNLLIDVGLNDKYILFRETEDSETQKLPSEELHLLSYHENDSTCYQLEYASFYNQTVLSTKMSAKRWLPIVVRGEHLTLYTQLLTESYGTMGTPQIIRSSERSYYCKRTGEPAATGMYVKAPNQIGTNGIFKKAAIKYFADHPELVEKIKNKDYTYRDLAQIVVEYNKWKSTQP